MIVGIDFDNTIACYDKIFTKLAQSEGLIPFGWNGSKQNLRDTIRKLQNGELLWQKLQGQVYGALMQEAEMFPGLPNIFLRFKQKKIKIYIVSHKTTYGHFDVNKIPLRTVALNWMDSKGFFKPEGFNINRDDIYFNSTRKEKIAVIKELGCDYFIDDLWEIFEDENFPEKTKRILFSDVNEFNEKVSVEITTNSWFEIGDYILGSPEVGEIQSQLNFFWGNQIDQITPLTGMGNSKIYKISSCSSHFALKLYPDLSRDKRRRLKTESEACIFLREKGVLNISNPVSVSYDLNMGLFEWIDGSQPISISTAEILQAIEFVQKLKSISKQSYALDFPFASEACLSIAELISQIERRLINLSRIKDNFPELNHFLKNDWNPLFIQFKTWAANHFPDREISSQIPPSKQILSPSDFGFHNAIKVLDGSLVWIDMEYFGWDDPVKLTTDFVFHPGMQLNSELKKLWLSSCINLFADDEDYLPRFCHSWALYGFRWSLIILSEFLNEGWIKRVYANQNLFDQKQKRLANQLDKSKMLIKEIRDNGFNCPYF